MVTGSLVPKTPFYHICSTYATSTGSTALGLLPLPLSLINFNAVGLVEVFHEVVIDAALGMMTVCQVLTVSHPFYEQLQKSGQRDDLTQLEGCPWVLLSPHHVYHALRSNSVFCLVFFCRSTKISTALSSSCSTGTSLCTPCASYKTSIVCTYFLIFLARLVFYVKMVYVQVLPRCVERVWSRGTTAENSLQNSVLIPELKLLVHEIVHSEVEWTILLPICDSVMSFESHRKLHVVCKQVKSRTKI